MVAEFIDLNLEIADVVDTRSERLKSEILKDKVFNTAVIKLLPKVWVRKEFAESLEGMYRPQYTDVVDYVRKTDPSRLKELKKAQQDRSEQVSTLLRKRTKQLRRQSTISFETQETMDAPPELDAFANELFESPENFYGVEEAFAPRKAAPR